MILRCRACHGRELMPLFSLGDQFVSDFVDRSGILSGNRCPIEMVLCRGCTLVQARYTAPQDFLYTRYYWYRSGVTQTMRDALSDVARAAQEEVVLEDGDVVLDIGSNDGTLLRSYTTPKNVVRVGVEPADNLATEENYRGLELVHDFWGEVSYRKHVDEIDYDAMGSWGAKVITACGMFYDLDDPNQFIADISTVLRHDGVFVAQLMCLKNMVDLEDVGNFAHEHLEFYSIKSLDYLLGKHGLEIYDLETNSVNGRSYRLFVRHKEPRRLVGGRVSEARRMEQGLDDPRFYDVFFQKMERNKQKTVDDLLRSIKAEGKSVWVYGASTKGNVILQYYGIDSTLVDGAAERSPEKWGKFTVGTGIEIFSEDYVRKQSPDYMLVLPYAFIGEFVERESGEEWRTRGGKFIVPLPEVYLV